MFQKIISSSFKPKGGFLNTSASLSLKPGKLKNQLNDQQNLDLFQMNESRPETKMSFVDQ